MSKSSRAIRICGASGSALDRRNAFDKVANSDDHIDVIVGDWMSEGNMPGAGGRKLDGQVGYEPSFLQTLTPALPAIAKKGIKVIVNAGASDAQGLCAAVDDLLKQQGLDLKSAWISGDNILDKVQNTIKTRDIRLTSLSTGGEITDWPSDIMYAQAYLGCLGIEKALHEGGQIIICGRVADASPAIGAAKWWHDWKSDQFHELAAAFVAGHLTECSTYVTGGNFSGFKSIPRRNDLGYPIAEISSTGDVILTKVGGSGGMVTVDTVKAQLLYEIQGPLYYHSDVTAQLDQIFVVQLGPDRIQVNGVVGLPPPPTTKIGVAAKAGYQAEIHWSIVGLDVEAKAKMMEVAIKTEFGDERMSKFTTLSFTTNGSCPEDPFSQNSATVDFRIFAQAKKEQDLSMEQFTQPTLDAITAGIPRPYYEYWVALYPQSALSHQVHLATQSISIPTPEITRIYPTQQLSYDSTDSQSLEDFGKTIRGPMGWIVHSRSGDKGSNANVGFWVRTQEEFAWLRRLLTISKMKQLLGAEFKEGNKIDRFELPGIYGVHFLLHDHLDRGVNSSSTYDILGKNLGEFLRARYVDLPEKFLLAGKI
ncbi:hypothetical protein DL95DRAFT_427354 [Leptodontidium sp. 2 PMI_412]|nr:hypothetical protein DL95DRAFT_427354 [Leptodontidium sp. 2 PMI_412]